MTMDVCKRFQKRSGTDVEKPLISSRCQACSRHTERNKSGIIELLATL